jgi:iron complex outermembrane receptor protein
MGNKNGWGLHIKATHQETDGYRDNSQNSSQALTIKTGYKFNDNHSIDIMTMNGYHRNGQGWIGSTQEELSINKRANGITSEEDDNWFMSMNRLQYKGWLSHNTLLSSTVYYQHQTGSYRMDLDNYMIKMVDKNWTPTNVLYDYGLTHNMYGGNILLKQYIGDLSLTAGVNAYQYFRYHYLKHSSKNVDNSEYYDNRGTKNDVSGFLQMKYEYNKFTVSGNVQYRYAEFYYDDYINKTNSFNSNDYNTEWNFVNYGFNIDYDILNNLNAYTSFSHVNREPTRSDMFGGNETFVGINTIEAEEANDVEAGILYKSKYVDCGLNYFYMWFDNELVLNGEYGLNGLPCHENANKSYRTGVELSMTVRPIDKLNIAVNSSYSKNIVDTDTYGRKNHILSPEWTFDSDISYRDKVWSAGVNLNYHSSMYVDMNNEYKLPYLMTVNLYGDYNITDDLNISLRANNITNRTNYNTGMISADGEMRYVQNAGFNVMGSVRFNF